MPRALRITSRLHVTTLLAIHHPPFEKLYQKGVYWSLFKERHTRPMADRNMLENVRESVTDTDVDGQQGFWLPTIGLHFGRLHGAILSVQTGNPDRMSPHLPASTTTMRHVAMMLGGYTTSSMRNLMNACTLIQS